jgi:hypothetical protein
MTAPRGVFPTLRLAMPARDGAAFLSSAIQAYSSLSWSAQMDAANQRGPWHALTVQSCGSSGNASSSSAPQSSATPSSRPSSNRPHGLTVSWSNGLTVSWSNGLTV